MSSNSKGDDGDTERSGRGKLRAGRSWDEFSNEGVRRVARLMVPGILGSSMAQVSLLLDTQIASFLVTGSVTWMYFADRVGTPGLQGGAGGS